jgi:hypothetical protein
VDFVVCTLAVKKKSGQVSTCRIGPFPWGFFRKANEMLFSQICNSHSDRAVSVSLSPDVTVELKFLKESNFSYCYKVIFGS